MPVNNPIDCFKKYGVKDLSNQLQKRIEEGANPYEAAREIILAEHRRLHDTVNEIRTIGKLKKEPYTEPKDISQQLKQLKEKPSISVQMPEEVAKPEVVEPQTAETTTIPEPQPEAAKTTVSDVRKQEFDAQKINKEVGVDVYVARQDVDANGIKYTLSQIKENGNTNTFLIEDANGNEVGKAQLSANGNYLENIRIDEKHRRKGLASKMYDFIELRKGIELEPSPNKQSKEAKALWDNRNLKKSVSKKANGGLLAKALGEAMSKTFQDLLGKPQAEPAKTTVSEPALRKTTVSTKKVYHGTSHEGEFDVENDGIIWFTDDKKIADKYRKRNVVMNEADWDKVEGNSEEITESELGIDVFAEEEGIDLSKGNIIEGEISPKKPLNLSEFEPNVEDLGELWDTLHEAKLVDEKWSEIDEEFQEEMKDDYEGKAIWRLLENEGVYDKAKKLGYDAVIINDVGVDGKPHISYGIFGTKSFAKSSQEPAKTTVSNAEALPEADKQAETKVAETPPVEPPPTAPNQEMGGLGNEDRLDKLSNNVPDTGKIAEYLSGETIQKYTGEAPMNDQTRGIQALQVALEHGEKIIEEAKNVFGEDYVEKTLNYIERSKTAVSNKALMYVSLENALSREKLLNPEKAADISKQQKLVYEKSQEFARQGSLMLNYQRLRKFAEVGYDISKVTNSLFSTEELLAREVLNKAVEANADLINEEYAAQETGSITPEVQKLIEEGIAKEVAKLYEALPKEKKSLADRAIKALEAAQTKLRSRTYDAGLGVPVAIVDAGITVIKNAIKVGVTIEKAIQLGINKIKELYKEELSKEREDKLRTDFAEVFDKVKSVKDTVKEILIEKGFGREVNVKGETKNILDWKKLAGEAGTVTKISENVGSVLKDKGYAESDIKDMEDQFIDEYVSLRQSIIEKAQNELAKRNKETVSPEQKSAAKKLSELYTYGLFDAKFDEYENTLNKALGAKVSEKGFNEAKNIAKALDNIYKSTFKGVRLNDVSAKSAIEKLEDKLRILLFRESKSQGNINLKAANIVRSYFDTSQTMLLNNLKQAIENPFSGLSQSAINTFEGVVSGTSNKELRKRQREAMQTIYKDMVLSGGIAYGKVESQFVNRQHLDDLVNKMSDKKLYHAIASAATGKATLNAMDSMFKASITEKKFVANLIKILTHESNPKRMTKKEALQFATERLTGQTYEEAKKTALETIKKINEDAGQELIPEGETQVERLANDIVKASLEMGGKITQEQIQAAYNAAYKSAGLNLGHEANNMLSGMMKGYTAKLEGDISRALKDKEWNRASFLIYKSVLFRNILNPFVGGGTNWLVLKLEKTGLGLFTGLVYKLGSKSDIDLSSEIGLKRLEARLYNQARYKDSFMRGLVGGVTSVLAYGLFKALVDDDEYRKFRKENPWAARYLDIATPEMLLAEFGIKDDEFAQYISRSFNRGDAFDPVNKVIKAVNYASKGEYGKMWGALGEGLGMKLNAPVPWRLVKDAQVIYQGIKGEDPYHGNYKPSNGFFSGVLQGGVIEWLGGRPVQEETSSNKKKPTRKERIQKRKEKRQQGN